jgi:Ca-activated chloride channel family protein
MPDLTLFRFAHPLALVLLMLPLIGYTLLRQRRLRLALPAFTYSDLALVDAAPATWRVRWAFLPDALRLLCWLLLVIALARPQLGRTQEVIQGQGIDIVLALDVSGSMAALDYAPQNRLEAARTVITDFIQRRAFDRLGLVVFARDAFHVVPPTVAYDALVRALGTVQLAPQMGLDDGTAVGMGLAASADMLAGSNAASRVIVLLTDGASNAGVIGPGTAATAAGALGIRVYTVGMGESGLVPVPVDAAGNTRLIESDLDEDTLRSIADVTGGQYFRSTDSANLERAYEQIDRLERSPVERTNLTDWRDLGTWLLVPAFILLLAEYLLRYWILGALP